MAVAGASTLISAKPSSDASPEVTAVTTPSVTVTFPKSSSTDSCRQPKAGRSRTVPATTTVSPELPPAGTRRVRSTLAAWEVALTRLRDVVAARPLQALAP